MIKLKNLLTEQKNQLITNWLNTNKKDFMNNLKKMGFNPRGFALNQLSIPTGDKDMGGVSLPQWYSDRKAFNLAGEPQKQVTNPKALASSVTTDEIILNDTNRVYIDAKAFAANHFDTQQQLSQSKKWIPGRYPGNSPATICASANRANISQYKQGNAQIIAINPVQGKNYNEVVIGKSRNLHLYSTKETATTTVPGKKGKEGTPDTVVIGRAFSPLTIQGTSFASNQATLVNANQIQQRIQSRITTMMNAGLQITQIGTITINASTDSMPTSRAGGNAQLARDRANTLFTMLTTQINPPIPANQINITTSPDTVPAGQQAWATARAAGVDRNTWIRANANARIVSLNFVRSQAADRIIRGTPPVPPTPDKEVDTPKKVIINHMEVFLIK